jgi:hypothetical protein
MTMHMMHPALSMSGKKKGKIKFRNAEEARKHRELESDWHDLQKKWGVEQEAKKRKRAMAAEPLVYSLSTPIGRTNTHHIKSLDTGHSGPVSSKPAPKYTGTKMLGVGQLHKSNAVPVFCDQDAIDIARMRRG